ncbi:MAG TPA: hypothetical protein VFJ94_11925, partial [Intrasporangium sp.]|uniref:hypothetical protein n=1 Tax=Intrasporangium sp. TaxID=1925024 RepID=UPI002D7A099B
MKLFTDPAAVAAIIAALVSGAVTWLFRFLDHPRPRWILLGWGGGRAELTDSHGMPVEGTKVTVDMVNVGTGAAHGVLITGHLCDVHLLAEAGARSTETRLPRSIVPVWAQGDNVRIHAVTSNDNLDHATFTLKWYQPPARPSR